MKNIDKTKLGGLDLGCLKIPLNSLPLFSERYDWFGLAEDVAPQHPTSDHVDKDGPLLQIRVKMTTAEEEAKEQDESAHVRREAAFFIAAWWRRRQEVRNGKVKDLQTEADEKLLFRSDEGEPQTFASKIVLQRILDWKGKWYPPPSPSHRLRFFLHRRPPSAQPAPSDRESGSNPVLQVRFRTPKSASTEAQHADAGNKQDADDKHDTEARVRIGLPPAQPAIARTSSASSISSERSFTGSTSSSRSGTTMSSVSASVTSSGTSTSQPCNRPQSARQASGPPTLDVLQRGSQTERLDWRKSKAFSRNTRIANASSVPHSNSGGSAANELATLALAMGSSTEAISQAWTRNSSHSAVQQVKETDDAAFHFINVPGVALARIERVHDIALQAAEAPKDPFGYHTDIKTAAADRGVDSFEPLVDTLPGSLLALKVEKHKYRWVSSGPVAGRRGRGESARNVGQKTIPL